MFFFKKIIFFIFLIFIISCSKDIVSNKTLTNETILELQVAEAYKQGLKSLDEGDVLFAAKKFNEAEILFPQSEWAPKAALMAAYSYYTQDYYGDAEAELKRFVRIYPFYKNLDYAYYLLGTVYYEQIIDEKKDLQSIKNAKQTYELVIKKYPNSEYAVDAEFKIGLIEDILASKEMYIGRYYFERKKWIPAINRFKTVIDKFEKTIYVEEALYRLVETYYTIGLENEAKKYAKLLGYNYQSSEWYEKSYAIFDKSYIERKKLSNEKKKNILSKFKSLIN